MNKIKSIMTWMLLLAASQVMGINVTVDPIEIEAGKTAQLVINLSNAETNLTAYQMFLYLPEGVTVQKKTNGKYAYTINQDRHDGAFTISVKDADGGSVLITCFSADKDVIKGASGELIRLPLEVASTVTTSLQGSLKNIEFSDVNAKAYKPADVTFNLTLKIPVEPVTITAENKTMTYGDDVPSLTYTTSGAALSGTPSLSTTATKTSPVGTYPIKVEKGTVTNEKVTYVEGTLTITQAPLTVGVQDVTITEGDAIPSFTLTYSGFRNDDTEANAFTTKPTATTTATVSSMPGTYPISVSGGESKNYALNYQIGTLTILEDENPASYRTYPLTLDIFYEWDGCTATSKIVNNDYQGEIHVGEKLAAAELIYGDMAVYYTHYADVTKYNQLLIEGTPGMELRVLLNRLEVGNGGGDENGGSWTELNPVIGDDGKAIVDLSDYEFVHLNAIKTGWESPEGIIEGLYLVKGKIEQPVTITANNLTMVYGDDIPTLTYSSEGGELKGTPKLSTTATKNSPVGTYPIKVEKGTVTNEKVSFVDGTLTIIQAPLTVGVVDVTITEGEDIPTFTLKYSGFRNNDYANRAFTKKPTATTTATSSSAPGTYPITISGGEAKNYELTYKPGTLTIEPAAGIESVYADGQGNAVIYNVNGQKLSKPRKGINIIGGKKVVMK